tara:strand:+ start:6486 stop:6968 length:483 start_codon:yes stop_codon:yes gene_type:complete
LTSSGNDGSSSGGAAGSIVFNVPVWNVSPTCLLTIQANGCDVASISIHVGGAGGGLGALIFSSVTQTINVTLNNSPGNGGANFTACGTAGDCIVDVNTGPLPIELISFEARANKNKVDLKWLTSSEINNSYFTVDRSVDALGWEEVLVAPGAGKSNQLLV